jgi:DNA-binding NarL/FixJ family response regulator
MARVLLVDDDPRIRAVAARLFERAGQTHRFEEPAASIASALRAIERVVPDVLIVDLGLPDGDGASLVGTVRRLSPATTCIALTVFDDDAHIFEALRAGAVGYLLKDDMVSRLLAAIGDALAGGAPMSPAIARRVLESFHGPKGELEATSSRSDDGRLTSREREVVGWLARGSTYDEIARYLSVSKNTVRTHIRSVYEKLHVSSKTEATLEAMRLGIVPRS